MILVAMLGNTRIPRLCSNGLESDLVLAFWFMLVEDQRLNTTSIKIRYSAKIFQYLKSWTTEWHNMSEINGMPVQQNTQKMWQLRWQEIQISPNRNDILVSSRPQLEFSAVVTQKHN